MWLGQLVILSGCILPCQHQLFSRQHHLEHSMSTTLLQRQDNIIITLNKAAGSISTTLLQHQDIILTLNSAAGNCTVHWRECIEKEEVMKHACIGCLSACVCQYLGNVTRVVRVIGLTALQGHMGNALHRIGQGQQHLAFLFTVIQMM